MALDLMIPFWGDPAMLRQTVRSVLLQCREDWLLTVIDDAYPDETVAKYVQHIDDSRVRYLRNSENRGLTENFRACVREATQDRIVILGCDDVLHPNYVDVVLSAHDRSPEVTIIQPGVQVIDEEGNVAKTLVDSVKQGLLRPRGNDRKLLRGEALATSLLHGNWLYWPSLAFRRDALLRTDFRDGFPIILDLALVLDMVHDGATLLLDPEVCFSYRRHAASESAASLLSGERFAGDRAYFKLAAQQACEHGWPKAERAARMRVMSRLHALSLAPKALRSRQWPAIEMLLVHCFGPTRP